ncbi:MAG: hypothetical protein ACRC20_03435 [Segniliparus sp.]|uniref:hypothetical protein n=1 Tax=Segniliparus sp. TaxID=2804064 RepID=UPI003F34E390
MSGVVKAIARTAPVAALMVFGLAPAMANAAPVAQQAVVWHMADAGSAGSGDSHGHNNNQDQQKNMNNQNGIPILRPGTRH